MTSQSSSRSFLLIWYFFQKFAFDGFVFDTTNDVDFLSELETELMYFCLLSCFETTLASVLG